MGSINYYSSHPGVQIYKPNSGFHRVFSEPPAPTADGPRDITFEEWDKLNRPPSLLGRLLGRITHNIANI